MAIVSRLAFAAALAVSATLPASAQTIRLMTGPQGGVWVPLGGQLKAIWERALPGITVQPLPGAGVANARGVDERRVEVGFGNSISTVDALNGAEPFPRRATNICNLATLYPQFFQVVALADSGIQSIRDLRGKAIAVQPRGNTAEVITRHILQTAGLSYSDVRVNFQSSYTDAVSLLTDGHAQAFTLGTTIPASSVMDLASARQIRIVDLTENVPAMRQINPGYTAVQLPANTYPQQTQAVTQIGYMAHLIVGCDQPEDRVYAMVKAIADNLSAMTAIANAMQGVGPRQMAEDIGVPIHPGARRFYREVGALTN